MLNVDEALDAILRHARPLPPTSVPLDRALGTILAEDVASDLDSPPFDKALVDGFAVRSADLPGPGMQSLRLMEEVTAGRNPTLPVGPGQATVIMTGAPLPVGADSVVMHEVTSRVDCDHVGIEGPVPLGMNRLERGREMRSGEVVARAGDRLTAARLGV